MLKIVESIKHKTYLYLIILYKKKNWDMAPRLLVNSYANGLIRMFKPSIQMDIN